MKRIAGGYRYLVIGVALCASCKRTAGSDEAAPPGEGPRIVDNRGLSLGEGAITVDEGSRVELGTGGDVASRGLVTSPVLKAYPTYPSVWITESQRIVVASRYEQRIFVYDSLGKVLVTIGHRGDGPGEFRGLVGGGVLRGDTIVAVDVAHRRSTWFDLNGTMLKEM